MRRRHRPVLWGLTAAVTTTAAGLSVNIVTDHQGSLVAWLAVAACTALTGTSTALIDRSRGGPQPDIPVERLLIECTVGPDGVTTVNARADGPQTARLLTAWLPPPSPDRAVLPGPRPPDETQPEGVLPMPVPVAMVTRSRATAIARRLAEQGERCAGSDTLDLRLCIDNRLEPRHEALRDAPVIVLDDRCTRYGPRLLIGGIDLAALDELRALAIVLSCQDGAGSTHTGALRRSLKHPAAFLGCAGSVPAEHLGLLYPALLDGIGAMAGAEATAENLRSAMDDALTEVQRIRPHLAWDRWTTTVLHPLPVPEEHRAQGHH